MRLIEVTGVPASGKSRYIDKRLSNDAGQASYGFDAGILRNSNRRLSRKYAAELTMWRLVLSQGITKRQFKWIVLQAFRADQPTINRLNIVRNCVLKLVYSRYLQRYSELAGTVVYIDEGISHIPMLVQRTGYAATIVKEFNSLFAEQLQGIEVICIEHRQEDLSERLLQRGHTRVNTSDKTAVMKLIADSEETIAALKTSDSRNWRLTNEST